VKRAETISPFTVAGTYVGTVVGAGFATGQEVMRFFTFFGAAGTWGVLLSTVLFALLGVVILQVAHQLKATSHREVLQDVAGPLVGTILDWVIAFFLFAGAAIMMAGSGAVFVEHWHLGRGLGTVIMAVVATGTVLFGLRGVVTSISTVAPVLIGMVLLIATGTIIVEGLSPAELSWTSPGGKPTPSWLVAALLYVSYNLILSISVLAPLGGAAPDARKLRLGGLAGGVALGVGALAINLALLAGLPDTAGYEVPMLHLATRLPGWVAALYGVVLWAEIYTTAVSSLFGLAVRFVPAGRPAQYRWFTIAAGAGALVLSQVGFAQMVSTIFPIVGWLGLLLIAGLLIRLVRMQGILTR